MDYEEGGLRIQVIEVKTTAMRIKHISEAIDNKDSFPQVEYFLGLDLVRFTPLNNGKHHCFKRTNSPFHQDLRKAVNKYPDQIGDMKPYLAIIPKPAKPLYEKMKLMYRYTIVEVEEAFKNLHRHSLTNRTKDFTYRLLYNMTPIPKGAKCAFCNEEQTEVHLYGLCKIWKGARFNYIGKLRK